ncbi:hypothetical protein [Aurantiacibacter hainanensis]|uniref:hypothetical protein n=1 Tax=Aurantiacibacter hainanensis TaxID=3076114 RepID=UPI0030C76265
MKKIVASTIAAGLVAATAFTATAAPVLRDAAAVTQPERLGEDDEGDAGTVLIVLAAFGAAAGIVSTVGGGDDGEIPELEVPVSP